MDVHVDRFVEGDRLRVTEPCLCDPKTLAHADEPGDEAGGRREAQVVQDQTVMTTLPRAFPASR